MAKIDEERILVRVSLLIRDTVSPSNITFITPTLISSLENYVRNELDNVSNLSGVIVEADNATDWNITVPPPIPTYTIGLSANTVSEGNSITAGITTTAVDDNTILYWTTTGATANVDFAGNANSGSFTITNNFGTFNVSASIDGASEGPEVFALEIRTFAANGNVVATSANITVTD